MDHRSDTGLREGLGPHVVLDFSAHCFLGVREDKRVREVEELRVFDFIMKSLWFLEVHRYDNPAWLLADLNGRVIGPVEDEVAKLRQTPP